MLFLLHFILQIVSSLTGGSTLTVKFANAPEFSFDAVPARFGIPDYDGNRRGNLTYLGSREYPFFDGCSPYPEEIRWTPEQNMIVMVDRGNCYFVDKVDHAEEAGARAVIVVEQMEGRVAIMSPPKDFAHSSVLIPAVSISKSDGDSIRQFYFDDPEKEKTEATIMWEVPLTNGKVNFELYTTSNDAESQPFKDNFGEIAMQLVKDGKLDFQVRYYIYNGTEYECYGDVNTCGNQCLNNGRYCAEDPDQVLSHGVSGMDNVYEDLRATCVWNFTQNNDHGLFNEVDVWFDYVSRFGEECLVKYDFDPNEAVWEQQRDCANAMLGRTENRFGITTNSLVNYAQNCMDASGPLEYEIDGDDENAVLESMIRYRNEMGVYLVPSFTINGYEMRGSWHCPPKPSQDNCNVFRAICAAYAPGTKPSLCFNDYGCAAGKYRDQCGFCVLSAPLDRKAAPNCTYDENDEPIPPPAGYPTMTPTATAINDARENDDEGISTGVTIVIIVICIVVVGVGCAVVFIYFIFKRNQHIRHERLMEEQGYLQTSDPTSMQSRTAEDGKLEAPMDAQTSRFFKQNFDFGHEGEGSTVTTGNGLIDDSLPPQYNHAVQVEDDAP